MNYEEDIKRIEKKVDLLFKLCFKSANNFTYGSYSWEEIKESIPLFNISAKKTNIKDFVSEEEIQKYKDKIEDLTKQVRGVKDSNLKRSAEIDRLNELHYDHDSQLTGHEIYTKVQELKRQGQEEYSRRLEKESELNEFHYTIEELTYTWFDTHWGKSLKEIIEKNYEAQFNNDMLKKLGIKRKEDDYSELISKAISENQELIEIFKKIDNYK